MSRIAKPWLPNEAIEPEALAVPLGRIVRGWSEHWFANAGTSIAPLYQDDWPSSDATGWRTLEGASIALTAACRCAVASAMLARSILANALQVNDRKLVDRLANECADDLVRRIVPGGSGGSSERVRGLPIDLDGCSWWQVSVSGARSLFCLAISPETAVWLAKSQLPPPKTNRMGTLRAALGGQQLSVSLDLGRCPIRLAELDSLAAGDVLVMDRSTEDPLELLLNGSRSPIRARIGNTEGRASLVIASKEECNG